MKVGELRELLARLNDDTPVVCVRRDESGDHQSDVVRVRFRNHWGRKPHVACEIVVVAGDDDD